MSKVEVIITQMFANSEPIRAYVDRDELAKMLRGAAKVAKDRGLRPGEHDFKKGLFFETRPGCYYCASADKLATVLVALIEKAREQTTTG